MSAGFPDPPAAPGTLPGGLTLPPLPAEYEVEVEARGSKEAIPEVSVIPRARKRPPREPRSGAWFWALLLGLVLGIGGGAGAAYYLYTTEVAPVLDAASSQSDQFARFEGEIMDLQAQLGAARRAQMELKGSVDEIRGVVATITVQTNDQLSQARNQVQKAQHELETLKLETALTELNMILNAERVPLELVRADVDATEVKLTCNYWSATGTPQDALNNLTRYANKLRAMFPGKTFPADFVVTFTSVRTNQTATFRNGFWEEVR